MMRHTGKQILTKGGGKAGLLLIPLMTFLLALSQPAAAQTSSLAQAYVVDPLTSVALGGFDPVSYFTEPLPLSGKSDFEYYWHGVSWYFANAANREVFARDPDIYAPQFGGYGTMSMARGYLSEGNPQIYAIMDNRLFLFYSLGNRDAFMQAVNSARVRAMDRWKVVEASLPRF